MNNFCLGKFWERKARGYIQRIDVDGDGKVTKADYEMLVDRYLKLGHADELKAKQITRRLVKIWYDFFDESATDGAVNSDEWIAAVRRFPIFGLFRVIVEFMNLFFDLIDINGDGVIQKEEYAFFLNAFRVEDKAAIENSFNALDKDGDGQIDHDEFVNAGLEFWMSDDENLDSKLLFGPLI